MPCPLFVIEAIQWAVPDPSEFDRLLLTSANALRHGGGGLAQLAGLDVIAVGPETADAARAAGLRVVMTGKGGIDALLDALPGQQRLLHLAGLDHRRSASRHSVTTLAVYRAVALDADVPAGKCVALVHSPRAGARFADLAPHRASISIAAISAAAARACGQGWATLEWPAAPSDGDLLALAARLCQD